MQLTPGTLDYSLTTLTSNAMRRPFTLEETDDQYSFHFLARWYTATVPVASPSYDAPHLFACIITRPFGVSFTQADHHFGRSMQDACRPDCVPSAAGITLQDIVPDIEG
jgi:hypothetical protein